MDDLTLIIPAKHEKDSLPHVIDGLKNLSCKIKVSLQNNDKETINTGSFIQSFKVCIICSAMFINYLKIKIIYLVGK